MPRMSGSWQGDTAAAPLTDERDRLRRESEVGQINLGRVDARMAQMLRHAIDARSVAQRLDRVHMAEIMKPERDSRSSASHRLCEGRRDGNPRAGRRWKDQVAATVEAGDMIERRWRQRYDSAPITLAFDNFERTGRLVELRPFQRGQFCLPRAGQSSSNGKASQMRRTPGEDGLNRSFVRQDNRVAPLAQSSDCVERAGLPSRQRTDCV
jgi:hypothetical protein